MKKTLFVLWALIQGICMSKAYAQTAITSKYNGYRDGDVLDRIITDKALPGERGENCVWTLPSIPDNPKIIRQTISRSGEDLIIDDAKVELLYKATDEELSMVGFRKPNIVSVQDRPMPELKYPFEYGDSIAGSFSRSTTYFYVMTIEGDGTSYTVYDGHGVLTDGDVVLENVSRIHHHNTMVSVMSEGLVSEVTEDKYLWYYPGCRYPVMDTRIVVDKSNGVIVNDSIYTSIYLPELQISELAYDEANSEIRDNNGSSTDIKAVLLRGNQEVLLDYLSDECSDVTFYAYDLVGRVLGKVTHTSLEKGQHQEVITLNNRPINGIVMLKIVAGNKQFTIKVANCS